jgi:hypothetical protein
LHEYLALLEGGAHQTTFGASLEAACLAQARRLWPNLGIARWAKHPRRVEHVTWSAANRVYFVHVTADWKNCFLILMVPQGAAEADRYILFDIGAQYGGQRLICPAFDLEEEVTAELVRDCIPRLKGQHDPFAILEMNGGTYIQTRVSDGWYDVEHQLVSTKSHYILAKRVRATAAVDLFLSYAFGKYEWACDVTWERQAV